MSGSFSDRFRNPNGSWVGVGGNLVNDHETAQSLIEDVGGMLCESVTFNVNQLAQTIQEGPPLEEKIRLPFPTVCFEFVTENTPFQELGVFGHRMEKIGVVLTQTEQDSGNIRGFVVADLDPPTTADNTLNNPHGWNTDFINDPKHGCEVVAMIQRNIDGVLPRTINFADGTEGGIGWLVRPIGRLEETLVTMLEDGAITRKEFESFLRLLWRPAKFTIQMLQCKNVTIEQVLPNRQQRRMADRTGEKPSNQYRIIVKVPGKQSHTIAGPRRHGEPEVPAHVVRGHFAEYTPERPLFGKYSGRFWIPAHVRGVGDIEPQPKDYVVKQSV